MKLEALKHQGKTSGQVVHKSRDNISDTESGRNVQRYIRLTYLIPELLKLVDEERIAFTPAVELSYLSEYEQRTLLAVSKRLEETELPESGRHLRCGTDRHDSGAVAFWTFLLNYGIQKLQENRIRHNPKKPMETNMSCGL